jgi:putative PEP-CTERM system histidine kinase
METKLREPLDLRGPSLPPSAPDLVRVVEASYSVALLGEEEKPIGFLTVNDRVTGQRYTLEDLALLKTFADQASATIRNRQLSNELSRAKEMQNFQTLSTFFVHDLKNLANRFALARQNIPIHFDKPAFREDLVKTMEKSVAKIDTMTTRLSSISRGSSANRIECDLNELVREALAGLTGPAGMNGSVRASIAFEEREIPRVAADPEEIQSVVTNLVLNAYEATGEGGRIEVVTSRENGWVLVAVTDDGPGMSKEFLANSLFKPFQTTKKNGLGIGLYQSKTVVEAHGGRIEVESAPGSGTTFRVFLPSGAKSRA